MISRRRFLRGAGTVAIALPISLHLDRSVWSAEGETPFRYISLFFSNGLPAKFAQQGYAGSVLQPLAPFQAKLAMLRGLSLNETGGAQLHYKGTGRFGKGVSPLGQASAGGESLDNACFRAYGDGSRLLNVNMHTHVTGGNPATRWYHSWRGPNLNNDELLRPRDVFDSLFGTLVPDPDEPEAARALRYRVSVLDSVLEQYREISGPASGYSAKQRAQLSDHLELVRELDQRVQAIGPRPEDCNVSEPPEIEPSQACTAELCPGDDDFYYGSGGANWNDVWELNTDLYAAAMRCGIVRFGTMGCTGGGDRYPIPELRASGVTESPHILAHDWRNNVENGWDQCIRWLMQKVAYFLGQLDDPNWTDPNGGTMLDNTLVLIGTELGGVADGQHHVDSMTYWLAGGGGRIASGVYDFPGRSDVDLYSTISRAMGIGERFGDPNDFQAHFDIIR